MSPIQPMDIRPKRSARGALVLLPPQSTWEAIDAIREKYDAQIVRWMPHIRLLHPFKEPEQFDECLDTIREVCATLVPFTITLSDLRYFLHPSGKGSLWIAPEPMDEVTALQKAFQERFPEFPQEHRFEKGFVPHVIVGQTRTHTSAKRITLELRNDWKPVSFPVDSVALVGRDFVGPMQLVHEIPFGTSAN